jgi:putative FmdB family regulatory protein
MPIYEYRCTSCGDEFETIQKVNSRPLRKCKQCNGKLEKLISRASFSLKGGGWFANDYSKAGSASKASSGAATTSSSPSTSKGSSSSSADAKKS